MLADRIGRKLFDLFHYPRARSWDELDSAQRHFWQNMGRCAVDEMQDGLSEAAYQAGYEGMARANGGAAPTGGMKSAVYAIFQKAMEP